MSPLYNLTEKLNQYLLEMGIVPIYLVTLIFYINLVALRMKIRDWKKLNRQEKGVVFVTIFGAIVLTYASTVYYIFSNK